MVNEFQNLNCPICDSRSEFIFTSKHSRRIFQCSNSLCSHFFTPMLEEAQGVCQREADIEQESNDSLAQFNERNIRLFHLLKSFMTKVESPIKILDFGAGNAHIARTFKNILKNDGLIYCVEQNPLCSNLYSKYDLIHAKTINDVPEKIDLIYMIEVIEHLEDPILTLKKLKALLKPNGKIFISTPVGSEHESATNAYDTASHLHFFTEKSLNLALRKAGLQEIVYKEYSEMYPLSKFSIKSFLSTLIKNCKDLVTQRKLFMSNFKSNNIKHLVGITEVKF